MVLQRPSESKSPNKVRELAEATSTSAILDNASFLNNLRSHYSAYCFLLLFSLIETIAPKQGEAVVGLVPRFTKAVVKILKEEPKLFPHQPPLLPSTETEPQQSILQTQVPDPNDPKQEPATQPPAPESLKQGQKSILFSPEVPEESIAEQHNERLTSALTLIMTDEEIYSKYPNLTITYIVALDANQAMQELARKLGFPVSKIRPEEIFLNSISVVTASGPQEPAKKEHFVILEEKLFQNPSISALFTSLHHNIWHTIFNDESKMSIGVHQNQNEEQVYEKSISSLEKIIAKLKGHDKGKEADRDMENFREKLIFDLEAASNRIKIEHEKALEVLKRKSI